MALPPPWSTACRAAPLPKDGSQRPAEPENKASSDKRLSRRARWLTCLALVPFGLFYTERASRSDYKLPPETPLYRVEGVIEKPQGRQKHWSIAIRTPDGKRLHLGCEPNYSFRLGHACLSAAQLVSLAGTRVSADYILYPDAFANERVVIGMSGPGGEVLVSPEQQIAQLRVARDSDRGKTWLDQLPLVLAVVLITGLVWELMYGFVAVLEWLVRLSRRS